MSVFGDIHSGLIGVIKGITPSMRPEDTFNCEEDGNGLVVELEELENPRVRQFDLRVETPPIDDKPGGGFPRNRFRVEFALRVVYPLPTDYIYVQELMASDVHLINTALLSPANFPDGVDAIYPPSGTSIATFTTTAGVLTHLVLEIPLTVIYRI